jgi:hypothetical protein
VGGFYKNRGFASSSLQVEIDRREMRKRRRGGVIQSLI